MVMGEANPITQTQIQLYKRGWWMVIARIWNSGDLSKDWESENDGINGVH